MALRDREDRRDRACATCGQHDAPHIYPVLAEVARLREALERIELIVWDESLTDEQVIGGVQQCGQGC